MTVENIITTGTHNGPFHCDDVMAYVILERVLGERMEFVRTRDPEVISTLDIAFDVGGGVYDHHHTDKEIRENGIPFSSVGLIWRDFGKELITKYDPNLSDAQVNAVFENVDSNLILGIDILDNGIEIEASHNVFNIVQVISQFNPNWDEDTDFDAAFFSAARFAESILENAVYSEISKVKAKGMVEDAFESRTNKELLILDQFCPWQEHLIAMDKKEEVKFVIFQSSGEYRIQTVPVQIGSFEARKQLPESWAGKRLEELKDVTGVKDSVFAHPGRFIAGTKSKEGIMRFAELALNE